MIVANGVNPPGAGTIVSTNTSTNWNRGVCTGHAGTLGQANDTFVVGILILKNAGPATVTVTGLNNDTGAAANIVLTGLTTQDLYQPIGCVNASGGFQVTPTVANTIVVFAGMAPNA